MQSFGFKFAGCLALFSLFACSGHEDRWHLKGPLWASSYERVLEPETNESIQHRGKAKLWELPLAPTRVEHLAHVSKATGSISVGTVVDGYLINGKRLPPVGPHHRATPDQMNRGTWEGSEEIIELLMHGAKAYAEVRPGQKLSIANIGRRGGGRILWSVSHRNGRDADILFPVLDSKGNPIQMDKMVHLNRQCEGVTADGKTIHLDVDGMLALVAALVDQEITQIQHLFVSNSIRKKVLRRAKAQKKPKALIKKIKAVLRQPNGALPHDDHLHIRIGCSIDDVLDGCRHLRSGAFKKTRAARERELINQATKSPPAERAQSIKMLGRLGSSDKAVFKKALGSSVALRTAAIEALSGQSGPDTDRLLSKSLSRGAPLSLSLEALRTIEARVDGLWSQSLKILLNDLRKIPDGSFPTEAHRTIREEAIWLAGLSGDLNLVDRLIPLVDQLRLRDLVHEALERITLIKSDISPPTAASWRSALPRNRKKLRKDVRARMKGFGVLRSNGRPNHRACYRALGKPWHALQNIGRRILDQTHSRAIHQPRWSTTDLRWYWRRKLRIR